MFKLVLLFASPACVQSMRQCSCIFQLTLSVSAVITFVQIHLFPTFGLEPDVRLGDYSWDYFLVLFRRCKAVDSG